MKIIGLYGMIESGKDTVAGILRDDYGYTQLSYGAFIRAEAGAGNIPNAYIPHKILATLQMLKGNASARGLVWAKPTRSDIRELLQWWGQWRFEQNPKYWVDRMSEEISKLAPKTTRIVISDVRLPIEYYYVRGVQGDVWRIERLHSTKDDFSYHPTEGALRHYKFDSEIDNSQDLIRLSHCVKYCMESYDPS